MNRIRTSNSSLRPSEHHGPTRPRQTLLTPFFARREQRDRSNESRASSSPGKTLQRAALVEGGRSACGTRHAAAASPVEAGDLHAERARETEHLSPQEIPRVLRARKTGLFPRVGSASGNPPRMSQGTPLLPAIPGASSLNAEQRESRRNCSAPGKRNVSILNVELMAKGLRVSLSQLFSRL